MRSAIALATANLERAVPPEPERAATATLRDPQCASPRPHRAGNLVARLGELGQCVVALDLLATTAPSSASNRGASRAELNQRLAVFDSCAGDNRLIRASSVSVCSSRTRGFVAFLFLKGMSKSSGGRVQALAGAARQCGAGLVAFGGPVSAVARAASGPSARRCVPRAPSCVPRALRLAAAIALERAAAPRPTSPRAPSRRKRRITLTN